jgi:two-component system NarL family sensor kinase
VGELTIWAPAIALGVTLPALLVPDGRLRSPRWRVVAATAVAGPAMFVVGVFLIPGPTSDTPVPFDNPLGQSGLLGQLAKGMVVAGLALHVASLLARPALRDPAVAGLAGVERQQLRWVATGATIAVLGVTVLWASSGERGSTRW